MLNVLFFIEPSFELELPQFKGNLLTQRVVPLAKTLRAAYGNHVSMKVVINDAIATYFSDDVLDLNLDLDLVVFKQSDLYDLLSEDPLQYRVGFFEESLPQTLQLGYASKIAAKLQGFIPDVIFAFNNANFLRSVYKNSLLFHIELGYFNRPPFPESWFFDPIGAGGSAWLNQNWTIASNQWKPNLIELETTKEIIFEYKKNINNYNPIHQHIHDIKNNYKSINMLALQFGQQPFFDGYLKIRSQLQLAIAVLEKTPRDEGLIITEHPIGSLNDQSRAYLLDHYPQYVPVPTESSRGGTSQFFAPHCKTLITPASTVAALKLFWGNGLINLTDRYLPMIADGHSLEGVWPQCSTQTHDKSLNLLTWMIHRFLNIHKQRENPEWLKLCIEVGMACQAKGSFIDFYNKTQLLNSSEVADVWLDTIRETSKIANNTHIINSFTEALHHNKETIVAQYINPVIDIADEMKDSDERMMVNIFIAQYHHVYSHQHNLAIDYSRKAADIASRLLEIEITQNRVYHYRYAVFQIAYFAQAVGNFDLVTAAVAELNDFELPYGPLDAYFKDRIANELRFI